MCSGFSIDPITTMMEDLTFERACDLVRTRPGTVSATESDRRLMYTYYKVATVGSHPNVPRPNSFSPKAAYWDAWNIHGPKLSAADARVLYTRMVQSRASES